MRTRILAWLLTVSLLAALAPASAFAEAAPVPGYLCQDYENGTGEMTASGASAALTQSGAGESRGALRVTAQKDYGCVRYPMRMVPNQIYQMSVWIKAGSALLIDKAHFIFQSPFLDGGGTGYTDAAVNEAGLRAGEWVQVQAILRFDGLGTRTGSGGKRFEVTGEGTIEVRLGDGTIAGTAGNALEYEMDDFCVFPVKSTGNLVLDGGFETNGYESTWTVSGAETALADGAAGTEHSLAVQVTGDWGGVQQIVPIRFQTGYRISFWARTDSEEWAGKPVQVILDRANRKTDANVPSYEYRQDPQHQTLSTEWTKYEIVYETSISTSDPVLPSFYFRVGDGKERVRFLVDEIEITGADSGSSRMTASLSGGVAVGQTIRAGFDFQSGIADRYFYRILREYQGRWVLLGSGETAEQTAAYPCREADVGSRIRFEVTGIDSSGSCTNTVNLLTDEVRNADVVSAAFEQAVWNSDTAALSALAEVWNRTAEKTVLAGLALYDRRGTLQGCTTESRRIRPGERAQWRVEIPNQADAEEAKLFVWEQDTMSPLCQPVSMNRLAEGQYLYLDAESGNDINDGSLQAPLKTLMGAQRQVRRLLGAASGDIYVILKPGVYRPASTIKLTNQDASADQRVVYLSYSSEDPAVISGGSKVTAPFELYDSEKGVYRAQVGTQVRTRQLFVNGVRADRARSGGPLVNAVNPNDNATLTTAETSLLSFQRPSDLEMVFYEKWTNPRCGVERISEGADGRVVLTMKQPGWKAMSNKGGTSVTVPAYYENALELLDEEGEWYLDTQEGYLYYKPRFFEDLGTAEVVMPVLEKLLTLDGISAAEPIQNIEFRGLEFAYTTWLRPSTGSGLCDAQNNHLRDEGDRLPEAAIEIKNAHQIVFRDCTFDRLGITALKLTKAIQNCTVEGNEFYEISGSAISLGEPAGDYNTIINPAQPKDFITGNRIANNYIHHTAVEYQSAAAISAGFPKNTEITHNEIYDSSYSSMHIGYGWDNYAEKGTGTQNLHITHNYIHNVMNHKIFDGGGIYTIGATGGTAGNPNLISENYLKDVKNYYGVLYTDEGSSFWRLSRNVIDQSQTPYWYGAGNNKGPARWLHVWTASIRNCQYVDNYSTTDEKSYKATDSIFEEPHLYPAANWPEEAQEIIRRSGIEPAYEQNFPLRLQELTAKSLTLTAGETGELSLRAATGKEEPYDLSGAAVYTRSRSPETVQTDGLRVRAKQAGTAIVDAAVVEQGMCRMIQVKINVE